MIMAKKDNKKEMAKKLFTTTKIHVNRMAQQATSRRRSKTLNAGNDGRHLLITKNREITHGPYNTTKIHTKTNLKLLLKELKVN